MTALAIRKNENITTVSREFGSNFEEKIIQAILSDPKFGEQIVEVLSPDLFEVDHLQEVVQIVKEHFFKYSEFPSLEIMDTLIRQNVSDSIKQDLCQKYLSKIKIKPLNGDSEYVKENSLKYFKTQHLKNTLLEDVIPRIQTANFEEIVPIMERAMQRGTDKNIGYEYFEDETERFKEDVFDTVASPWPLVNEYLNGGFGAKRLATFIGVMGSGKSHLLVNVGYGALLKGKTVVHYTLELDELDTARRYDACATGVEINDIPKNRDKVLVGLRKIIPPEARLVIKEFPMKSASVQTIRSHIARLRLKDIVPDMLIVDYGDLLKSIEHHKESRHALESIWRDLKALAQEMKIPVVTATQTNRSAFNSDVVTPDQISEDFSKCMVSDILITIARNMEQKAAGVGKMLLAKNRQGRDGQIFCYSIDTACAKIECFELTGEDEEEFKEQAEKKFDDHLANKLNEFLKERNKV